MLAKKTSKNQLTLPKRVADQFPDAEYFDVGVEQGRIVLRPVSFRSAFDVRERLGRLGITEKDVRDAVAWARGTKR
jgi:hypothetical protein